MRGATPIWVTCGGATPTIMGQIGTFSGLLKNRIIHDFAYVITAHGLFERFPRLRVAFIEFGCAWVPSLLEALEYLGHGGELHRATRRTSSSSTAGSRPSWSRTSTSWPATSRWSGSCSGPTGRTARASRSPRTSSRTSKNFSLEDQRRIMYENARELTFS